MDNIELALLFDFYGDLLPEKQRECCDLKYNEDLSLAEIAEHCGISRQGVWDNIRHAENALAETERKLGIVEDFLAIREELSRLEKLTDGEAKDAVRRIRMRLEK